MYEIIYVILCIIYIYRYNHIYIYNYIQTSSIDTGVLRLRKLQVLRLQACISVSVRFPAWRKDFTFASICDQGPTPARSSPQTAKDMVQYGPMLLRFCGQCHLPDQVEELSLEVAPNLPSDARSSPKPVCVALGRGS